MQLYGVIILDDFAVAHTECRGHLSAWRNEIEEARWKSLKHLQKRHITAQVAQDGRVVFRLLGICMVDTKVRCELGIVLVQAAWVDGQPAKAATRALKK